MSQADLSIDSPSMGGHSCENCGSPVDSSDQFCPACGSPQPQTAPADSTQRISRYFACNNCGAKVATDPEHRSYVCPFCDSTYVVEYSPELTGRQDPEFVIGFRIPPEEALERFKQWIGRGNWFRPGDLKMAQVADKMRGVYLPFWGFTMLAQSGWSAEIGEYWYRTETYTTTENGKTVTKTRQVRETEWWPLSGRHHRYYNGFLVSGSQGLPQKQAEWIKPFQLPALKRYKPEYLAGWLSEEYSIEQADAEITCRQEFERQERENIENFLPRDTNRGLSVHTSFSNVTSDLCLLPIYLVSYNYRGKLYRFLLNGQTGKASGQKPVSWTKIGIAAGLGLLLILAIVLLIMFAGR